MKKHAFLRRLQILAIIFGVLFVCTSCLLYDSSDPDNGTQYELVWSDEFNGNSLDLGNWNFDIGTGVWGWGNNEQQYYTSRPENISVNNGVLKITAIRESYAGSQWTSARINSMGKREFTYGKMVARISLPDGKALWPAFWMLGSNFKSIGWPRCGEIDIMERVNAEPFTHGHAHWEFNGHADWGKSTKDNGWNNFEFDPKGWHEYAIEWDENAIKWYVDDKQVMALSITGSDNGTDAFRKPFYFLLNLAVGGQWPGMPDNTTPDSSTMFVDYVRVYQKTDV